MIRPQTKEKLSKLMKRPNARCYAQWAQQKDNYLTYTNGWYLIQLHNPNDKDGLYNYMWSEQSGTYPNINGVLPNFNTMKPIDNADNFFQIINNIKPSNKKSSVYITINGSIGIVTGKQTANTGDYNKDLPAFDLRLIQEILLVMPFDSAYMSEDNQTLIFKNDNTEHRAILVALSS